MEEFFTFPKLCLTFDLNLIQQGFDLFSPGDSAELNAVAVPRRRLPSVDWSSSVLAGFSSGKPESPRPWNPGQPIDSADDLTGSGRGHTHALRCKEGN